MGRVGGTAPFINGDLNNDPVVCHKIQVISPLTGWHCYSWLAYSSCAPDTSLISLGTPENLASKGNEGHKASLVGGHIKQ